MFPPASSPWQVKILFCLAARCGCTALKLMLGVMLLSPLMSATIGPSNAEPVTVAVAAGRDPGAEPAFAVAILPPEADNEIASPEFVAPARNETDIAGTGLGGEKAVPPFHAAQKTPANFVQDYRSILRATALMNLAQIKHTAAAAHATIVGLVSTYNPYRDGGEEGGPLTASGEPYDSAAWTAAIQIDLRKRFGGVRYGRLYQAAYALVESGGRQLIVKVNDVGPLMPGRVLDLNERGMRYFDPFLTRGVLADVKVTPLPGGDWTPGPLGDGYLLGQALLDKPPGMAPPGVQLISMRLESAP